MEYRIRTHYRKWPKEIVRDILWTHCTRTMKESKDIGSVRVKKGDAVFPCKNGWDTNRRGIRVRFGKHFRNIGNVEEEDLVECNETHMQTAERISTKYRRVLNDRGHTKQRKAIRSTWLTTSPSDCSVEHLFVLRGHALFCM